MRTIQARWRAIVACGLGTLVLAAVVAVTFTKRSWEATAMLAYSPIPVPLDFQDLYDPPELSDLRLLATSDRLLEEILAEFELPMPAKSLRKLIHVEPAGGSKNMLEISFSWGDPEKASALVDRLTELFRHEVARVRKTALGNYYSNLQKHLGDCKTRLGAARERLRDYSRQENVVDAEADLGSLQEDISSLEQALAKSRRQDENLAVQSKRLAKHIEDLKSQEQQEARETQQYQAAHESIADARRRQDRLRELIDEERRVTEIQAQLHAKRREYERAAVLVEKQLIPRTRFERIQGEMETLIARIKENEDILKWKHELEGIDETVVPQGQKKRLGSPIIAQVLFRKLELDLQTLAAHRDFFQLQKTLTEKRIHRDRLVRHRHEFQSLQDDVTAVDGERRATQDRLAVLRTLRGLGPVEFSLISAATAGEFPAKSNRKILFLAAFVIAVMFCGAGLVGLEIRAHGWMSTEDRLARLGLTLLGRFATPPDESVFTPGGRPQQGCKAVRRLALQIRQALTQPGATVLFSSLNPGGRYPALLSELAWCLARRDERVLLFSARDSSARQDAFEDLIDREAVAARQVVPAFADHTSGSATEEYSPAVATGRPGLAEFLSFVCMELPEFIFPTLIPGVDCLSMGESALPSEGIATHRMNELVASLRDRYSIILIDGPPVDREDDLELLVPYSNGIVFTAERQRALPAQVDEVLSGLTQLRAPIIGVMIV